MSNPALVTFESVYAEFQHWRANKATMGYGIPEALWQKIFRLESHMSSKDLRRIFGLNSQQGYNPYKGF